MVTFIPASRAILFLSFLAADGLFFWQCMTTRLPRTPPILDELVRAHQAFVERKRAEKRKADQLAWVLSASDEVDAAARFQRRQEQKAEHLVWILNTAAAIDAQR